MFPFTSWSSAVPLAKNVVRPDIPSLPDFPYEPRYSAFHSSFHSAALRCGYIDEQPDIVWDTHTGQRAGRISDFKGKEEQVGLETMLCLHGEPTWSYLYRKMIPTFLETPPAPRRQAASPRYIIRRVVAPDFIGFGRSDKPVEEEYFTWHRHREWLVWFVEEHLRKGTSSSSTGVKPSRTILVTQDWGGILGLLLPAVYPTLFTHLIVMNTALGLGLPPTPGWIAFRNFMARPGNENVDIGGLIQRGTTHLSQEEIEAYRLPFTTTTDEKGAKAGVRRFPPLVPILPHQEGVAESRAVQQYYATLAPWTYTDSKDGVTTQKRRTLQVLVCIGEADPVLGGPVMEALSRSTWGKSLGYWRTTIPEAVSSIQSSP